MNPDLPPPPDATTSTSSGWFKASRGETPLELIRSNPLAYVLAAIIAHRARWRPGFNRHGLGPGEAMLGDFENYGMSERQYRTAKANLSKWQFATFKTTNAGTIAKLIDTRLFSVFPQEADDPNARRPTTDRRPTDGRPTTNIEQKNRKDHEEGGSPPAQRFSLLDLKDILVAKEREAKRLRDQHCAECAMDKIWDDEDARTKWAKLRLEIKVLNAKIASTI